MRKSNISDEIIVIAIYRLIRRRLINVFKYQHNMNEVSNNYPIDVFLNGNEIKACEYRRLLVSILIEKRKTAEYDKEKAIKYFNTLNRFSDVNVKHMVRIFMPVIAIIVAVALNTTQEPALLHRLINETFNPYFELIKEKSPEEYSKLERFICNVVYGGKPISRVATDNDFLYSMEEFISIFQNINTISPKFPSVFMSCNSLNERKQLLQPLSSFDLEVYHAIITLFHFGYSLFTPQLIFDVLSGNKKREATEKKEEESPKTKLSAHLRKKIENSIATLQNTEVKMYPLEMSYHEAYLYQMDIENPKKWDMYKLIHETILSFSNKETPKTTDDPTLLLLKTTLYNLIVKERGYSTFKLLPCGNITNKKIDNRLFSLSFSYLDTPPLYYEAKRRNQLLSVDLMLLDTPLKNTEENIVLKCYLLRMIAIAKANGRNELTINFKDIYEYLGKQTAEEEQTKNALRVQQFEIRKKVRILVEYWSTKDIFSSVKLDNTTITLVI